MLNFEPSDDSKALQEELQCFTPFATEKPRVAVADRTPRVPDRQLRHDFEEGRPSSAATEAYRSTGVNLIAGLR